MQSGQQCTWTSPDWSFGCCLLPYVSGLLAAFWLTLGRSWYVLPCVLSEERGFTCKIICILSLILLHSIFSITYKHKDIQKQLGEQYWHYQNCVVVFFKIPVIVSDNNVATAYFCAIIFTLRNILFYSYVNLENVVKKIEKNGCRGGGVHTQIKLQVIIMLKEHWGKRVDKTRKTRAGWTHFN